MAFVDRSKTRPGTTRRGRMVGHNYAYPGYYFVTVCTHERQHLFGRIHQRESMIYSPAGRMICEVIDGMEARFDSISLDCYIVMPNHLHLLIGMSVRLSDDLSQETVSDVVKWVKNSTVRRFGIGVRDEGWESYDGRLWQKGFHDHIVRNERELETLRSYVANNIMMWQKDTFYDE